MNRQLLPFEAALVELPFINSDEQKLRAAVTQRLRLAWLDTNRHIFEVVSAESYSTKATVSAIAPRHWGDKLTHLIESVSECCFTGSNLDQRLRILGIRVLVFSGGQMAFNLETAVRCASSLGYTAFVAHDCCDGVSSTLQHYAVLRSSDEIIASAAPILSMPRGS